MDVYRLLKLNRHISNHRVKFLGLFLLHKLNLRYLSVNIDPILGCNLRCKMCYFTDPEKVRSMKGILKEEELERIANTIFYRALKLQIGCGTEPTLYNHLVELIRLGKKHKVPYISITTNANLLDRAKIIELIDAGLDEFTISLHGLRKESYEYFMGGADFKKIKEVFFIFKELKNDYNFKIRVNYTFNKDNFKELENLFQNIEGEAIDILQLRPIQDLGNTAYQHFDLSSISGNYSEVFKKIKAQSEANNVTLLAPENLNDLDKEHAGSSIVDYTFCYVSPNEFWKDGFNWKSESFNQYSKRIGWSKTLLSNIFKQSSDLPAFANRLNYEVDFN